MKFTIQADAFAQALGPPARVANTQATKQAVGGALIEANTKSITITGTDYTTSVKVTVAAQVEETGKALVPIRRLFDCVKATDLPISIMTEQDTLRFKSGRFDAAMKLLPVGNFPALSVPRGGTTVELDSKVLVEAIAQVLPATGTDESRPSLMAVQVRLGKDRMELIASDAVRIARRTVMGSCDADYEGLVERVAVQEVQRAAMFSPTLTLTAVDDKLVFVTPNFKLLTTSVEGEYPSIESLLSRKFTELLTVNRLELVSALKRVSLMADDPHVPVHLLYNHQADELVLTVASPGVGTAVEGVSMTGDPIDLSFNAQFLLDGLEAARSEEVTLQFIGERQPLLLDGANDFQYVLMPVRVNLPQGAKV
jgi:DNA polymerase-3 subunit beta